MQENQAVRVTMENDLDKPWEVTSEYFATCPRCGAGVGTSLEATRAHKDWHRQLGH